MSRHGLGDPDLQALKGKYLYYPFLNMFTREGREGYAGRHRREGCGLKRLGGMYFFMRLP